ncbi:MAG: hypothetical protein WCK51_13810 [Armatimonadota bacterium]
MTLRFFTPAALTLLSTCALAQFGAPSRLEMISKNDKERGLFVSLNLGSSSFSSTSFGSTSTVSQPTNGLGAEFVLNRGSQNPIAIGYGTFQFQSTNNLNSSNMRDLYAKGYFSNIWGASFGELNLDGNRATYFTLFADLWPRGDNNWSTQIGFGSYSGSGDRGSVATTRISFRLNEGLFLDLTTRSMMSSDSGSNLDFTTSFFGITKRF